MVRAWYMDSSKEDPHLPHMTDPPQFVDVETLATTTGCVYVQLNLDHPDTLGKFKKDRRYTYQDQCNIRRDRPGNNQQFKYSYREHMHSDEEVRFCIDGRAYFDARDVDDRWVRIEISKGDLLILPAGIYHRFILDETDYILLGRFFAEEPAWTPINRPAEDHPARKAYLDTLSMKG